MATTPRKRARTALSTCLIVGSAVTVGGCWVVRSVGVHGVVPGPGPVVVTSPVKAHLANGYTVLYPAGVRIADDSVRGSGTVYDLRLTDRGPAPVLPLDSLVGMETYQGGINAGATVAKTTLLLPIEVLVTGGLGAAIFGSCPTFYSDSSGTPALEAEGFSYAITPLFEARGVDRLRAEPDPAGTLRLDVRNEALETHYLNQLELLAVAHQADEVVLPDDAGRPLAVSRLAPAAAARDRAGRDVRTVLHGADGRAYRTDDRVLARADARDPDDHIDLSFPVPAGADSAAIVFRLRNSLLNTVLLYDLMMADPGARSLDWQGQDLNRIGPAGELGRWYTRRFGLRIAVWRNGRWDPAGRLHDTGPIAWKDEAAVVPVPPGPTLKVRLSFVADNWRIDRVQAAFAVRRPEATALPLARVERATGAPDTSARAALVRADQRYLMTEPGQRFTAVWNVGPSQPRKPRTFLLVSQGYYTEWMRPRWISASRRTGTFIPGDSALTEALARYRGARDTMELRFATSRVPVR